MNPPSTELNKNPLYLLRGNVTLTLAGAEGVISRLAGPDNLQIADSRVSAPHARWKRLGVEQIAVRDLGSTNGTYISNEPVGDEWTDLTVGETIDFGRSGAWLLTDSTEPQATRRVEGDSRITFRVHVDGAVVFELWRGGEQLVRITKLRAELLLLLYEGDGWLHRDRVARDLYGRHWNPTTFTRLLYVTRKRLAEHGFDELIESEPGEGRLRWVPKDGLTVQMERGVTP